MLKPGERILYKARIHPCCYVIPSLVLAVGCLLTFPPSLNVDTHSRFYPVQQTIQHEIEAIKNAIPPDLLPYLVTFQAIRTNYLGFLLLTVGGIRLMYAIGYRNFSRYWVTNMRVISQTSTFYNNMQEIPLNRLGDIRIRYGRIGHLINRGMVLVHDKGMFEIELRNLSRPQQYREAILKAAQMAKGSPPASEARSQAKPSSSRRPAE